MSLVTHRPVVREKTFHDVRNVGSADNVADADGFRDGENEIGAGVVAGEENVAVLGGGETAGERREVREG